MPLLALILKDLRLLFRDRTGMFFALIFPVLMAVFFGAIFSGGSDSGAIDVVLIDEDRSAESAELIAALAETEALEIRRAASREEAIAAVRRGENTAYLAIPAGFARARASMFAGGGAVVIGVDPSRRAEAAMLSGIVARRLYADLGALFGQAAPPSVVAVESVVRTGEQPSTYFAISFPQGIVWGLMMCAMTFGLGLVNERSSGTLMRLRVAPISRAHILAGKAGACMATVLVVQIGLLALGAVVFDVELGGAAVLAMAVVSSALCFVGLMMLLSILGRTEKAASGYATGVMIVLMMLGGGMVPLMFMPDWMQMAGTVSPVKWALLALEGATWRGFSAAEMIRPCAVLVGVGVAGFATGAAIFRD
jgi:ABC-2 type transport system permease protein